MSHTQKSVLVTGASGAIGMAAAELLSQRGWRVFAAARDPRDLAELANRAPIVPIREDICDATSVQAARTEIETRLDGQGLDALIGAAGTSVDGAIEAVSIDALKRQFDVNVFGQIAVIQAMLPLLRVARGRIVSISGAAARVNLPMYGALGASKAALESLSDALRLELAHQGVSVSYVQPGAVQTEFFTKSATARRIMDEDTDPGVTRIYATAMAAATTAMTKSRANPISDVTTAILKALTDKTPAARYTVGFSAKAVTPMLAKLPTRQRDRILSNTFGLTAESFRS